MSAYFFINVSTLRSSPGIHRPNVVNKYHLGAAVCSFFLSGFHEFAYNSSIYGKYLDVCMFFSLCTQVTYLAILCNYFKL